MRYRDRARSIERLIAVTLLAGGLTLACSGEESAAPEPETPASAESTPPPPSLPDDLEAQVVERAVPDGFPSDVPIYPASEPAGAMVIPGLGMFATFRSDDPPDQIIDHFRGSLEENGWSVSALADGVDATKGDRSIQVRVRPEESGSGIAVNISESS